MKRILTLIAFFTLTAGAASAQTSFVKNDLVFNLGIGIGNYVYNGNYTSKFPPLSLSGEYGVADRLFNNGRGSIGVGGYLGYTGAKWAYTGYVDTGVKYNNIIIGARGALHYEFVRKLDTYVGLMLGYDISTSSTYGALPGGVTINSPSVGGFAFALYVGARYYFTDNFGVFGEFGYGVAPLNLGITYKF